MPEGVGRGGVGSGAENPSREVGIDPVEDGAGFFVGLDELELEERRLADQLLRALPVEEAGELDQDAVVALLLKRGLGDAELVDSIPDDLHRLIGRPPLRLISSQNPHRLGPQPHVGHDRYPRVCQLAHQSHVTGRNL